jgi:hypothetical protein
VTLALTIWHPWATLIMIGAKPYEFRSWRPPRMLVGQRLAVHAGARPVRSSEVRALIMGIRGISNVTKPSLDADIALPVLERVMAALKGSPDTLWGTAEALTLPLSHVLGTAVVGEPKSGDECAREFGIEVGNDSDREGTFNWGWPMLDIEPLVPPMPARGAQGLWDWRP